MKEDIYTIEDIYNLPEGERAELIDGQIYTKLFKYRTAGVREYWLVDPDNNLVLVYNFEHGTSEPYTLQDSVKAGIYEDLWIDFSAVKMNGFC